MGQSPRRGRRIVTRFTVLATAAVLAASLVVVTAAGSMAAGTQFGPYRLTDLGSEPEAIAIGDVTGDGRNDVVVTTGYDNAPSDFKLMILAGQADGSLASPVAYATAGTYPDRPETVDLGDIDGDGLTDVVVGLSGLGIQVFHGQADGTLGAPEFVASVDSLRVAVGAFDGSGSQQIAGIGWGTGTVTIFADDGSGLAVDGTYAAQHGGYDDLEAGDVTGDGHTDVIVMSGQSWLPNVSVLAQIDGGFAPAAEYRVGTNVLTSGIGIGEVTGDDRADVLTTYGGNSPNAELGIFMQDASGGLDPNPIPYQSYDLPGAVEVADIDKDGWNEAIVVHDGWGRIGVYRGQVGGLFVGEDLYPVPFSNGGQPHGLAIGDVTGDGWDDIAFSDDLHGLLILPNAGEPGPTPSPTPFPTPSATPVPTPSAPPVPTATPTAVPTPTPTPAPVPPSVPRSLAASPNLAAGVGLTWQAPTSQGSSPITGYRLYRAEGGGSLAPLVTVNNVLAFNDASVDNGTTYRYAIAAISAAGEGPRSTEVTAVRGTAPAAPGNMTATSTKSGIALTWSAPPNGGAPITGYRVYRGTAAGGTTFHVAVGPSAIGMTDTSVAKRTKYFYRVSAVNVLGEGASSAEVNATAR